jgi:hypothetical protein
MTSATLVVQLLGKEEKTTMANEQDEEGACRFEHKLQNGEIDPNCGLDDANLRVLHFAVVEENMGKLQGSRSRTPAGTNFGGKNIRSGRNLNTECNFLE